MTQYLSLMLQKIWKEKEEIMTWQLPNEKWFIIVNFSWWIYVKRYEWIKIACNILMSQYILTYVLYPWNYSVGNTAYEIMWVILQCGLLVWHAGIDGEKRLIHNCGVRPTYCNGVWSKWTMRWCLFQARLLSVAWMQVCLEAQHVMMH